MPYVNFNLATQINDENAETLKSNAAAILQKHAGKGESWLYVRVSGGETLYFKGNKVARGGVVEIQLVGTLSGSQKQAITQAFGELLNNETGSTPDQTYVIFTEVKGENWGWNGQTFG